MNRVEKTKQSKRILNAAASLAVASVLLCISEGVFAIEFDVSLPAKGGGAIHVKGDRAALLEYAKTFESRGDYSYARVMYEKLISADPSDVRAYILLGRLYDVYMEKYVKALHYYKMAEKIVPYQVNPDGKAFCQSLIAATYRTLAEKSGTMIYFVQAIGAYEKLLQYTPNDMEAMYYLASCRLNTNDFERAIRIYEYIVKKSPDGEWAELSREALSVARHESRKHSRS